MEFLRFKPFTGSREFRFHDPDTHRMFRANDMTSLITQIVTYRKQNELPEIEHIHSIIENYLCRLPCNTGACMPNTLKRGFLQYLKGGIALLQNVAYQSFVPQNVADLRSRQCLGCKYNVFPDKGPFLSWSDDIMEASVGERRAAGYKALGSCEACSCTLKAKVWYDGKAKFSPEEKVKMEEVDCWQLKQLKQLKTK